VHHHAERPKKKSEPAWASYANLSWLLAAVRSEKEQSWLIPLFEYLGAKRFSRTRKVVSHRNTF